LTHPHPDRLPTADSYSLDLGEIAKAIWWIIAFVLLAIIGWRLSEWVPQFSVPSAG
jgi:hypothetical protein